MKIKKLTSFLPGALNAFLLLSLVLGCGVSSSPSTVKILSQQNGAVIQEFQVEIADDPGERSMGLMFREELGKDKGMLFIFPADTTNSFWMKNTLIPLDIIFVGADKKIVSISENATPQTTTPRHPEGPYRYVLEIEGGRSAELGIGSGDGVDFSLP